MVLEYSIHDNSKGGMMTPLTSSLFHSLTGYQCDDPSPSRPCGQSRQSEVAETTICGVEGDLTKESST